MLAVATIFKHLAEIALLALMGQAVTGLLANASQACHGA